MAVTPPCLLPGLRNACWFNIPAARAKLSWSAVRCRLRSSVTRQSELAARGQRRGRRRLAGCGKAVKANFGDVGYYRVQYDSGALSALTAAFKKR